MEKTKKKRRSAGKAVPVVRRHKMKKFFKDAWHDYMEMMGQICKYGITFRTL